jgi:hypothetical protein
MRGPIMPVCRADKPCSGPAAGVKLEFVRGGLVRGRVTTARDGSFKVALPPGNYAVRGPVRMKPVTALVLAARWTKIAVSIDTGIR